MKNKYFAALLFITLFIARAGFSETKTIRTGYFNYDDHYFFGSSEKDAKGGYCYDYLIEVSNYADWKYEYVYGDWATLFEMFKNHELDILTDVSYDEERASMFLFPEQTMGSEDYYLFILPTNKSISPEKINDLDGKIIGTNQDFIYTKYLEKWVKDNKINCSIVYYSDEEKYYDDFKKGKLDLIVDIDLNNTYDWIPMYKIGSSDFYIAVSDTRPDLFDDLNKALQIIYSEKPFYNAELHSKHFSNIMRLKLLNDKEKEWVDTHAALKIGCLKDFLPFCAMDSATGEAIGLLPVIMKRIFEEYDITDKLKLQYIFYTTEKMGVNALKANEIDAFFPANESNWDAEMNDWFQTPALAYAAEKLIYRGIFDIDKIQQIGIITSTPDENYANSVFPASKIITYDSYEAAFKSVINGSVDSVLANGYKTQYYLKTGSNTKLKVYDDLKQNIGYSIIFTKNNDTLFHMINRGLKMLDPNFIESNINYYAAQVFRYTEDDFWNEHKRLVSILAIIFFFLIGSLFYTSHKLRNYSNYDELTHLFSERNLKKYLKDAIRHAEENEDYFCIIIAAISGFNTYVNTYGNECGDEILKYVSKIFIRGINKDDMIFRYKRDKIFIILNNKLDIAENVAIRITKQIESEVFIYRDNEINLTMSTGISAYADGAVAKVMIEEAENELNM